MSVRFTDEYTAVEGFAFIACTVTVYVVPGSLDAGPAPPAQVRSPVRAKD